MNDSKLLVEQTLSSEEKLRGKLLHVFADQALLPDGSNSGREWIRHPGACAVVPVFPNGDILMLKQFRYPVKQIFWEVPAGKIDEGEEESDTARRELAEEAGIISTDFNYVGHFYPCIGYSDEVIHIYLARDLEETDAREDAD